MYQYSLDFFKLLFIQAIASSEPNDDLEVRLGNLNKETLESLYRNICRSLFAKDKLVFSTMLAMKLMELTNTLDQGEWCRPG
jgi:dynein heavy chain, axonemal